jgi:capsular polysaccharide export protein
VTTDSLSKVPPARPGPLGRAARWAALAGARLAARPPGLGATSAALCADPAVAAALGAAPALVLPGLPAPPVIVGWGASASGRRAARRAARTGAQLLLLEDGFLRSARREDPPLSIVIDDLGLYHDARRPSRLERQIAADPADPVRARRLARLWRDRSLSKIAGLPACTAPLPPRYVLVLDQLMGDASVAGGLAHPGSFDRMLAAARAEFPQLPLVLKTHPDTALLGRRSHFAASRIPQVVAVTEACDPAPLIAGAEAVYTVTSQGGFEALLHGRPVRCFGMPFYAGWGLTEDDLPPPPRRGKASFEALVHAALVDYPRYLDPDTGRLTTVEATMERLARPAA